MKPVPSIWSFRGYTIQIERFNGVLREQISAGLVINKNNRSFLLRFALEPEKLNPSEKIHILQDASIKFCQSHLPIRSECMERLKFLGPTEVPHLAKTYGTPVFVYDIESMTESLNYFMAIPNAYGLRIRFSVKANPNQSILKIFDALGAYFDVSSIWEAQRVLNAGIPAQKILFTGQEASTGWKEFCGMGMEFDGGSLAQLDAFGKAFPGKEVSIRINPGFGSGLVKKLTSGGSHSSFGIWHERLDEVLALVDKHRLSVTRLHFHIGSGHEAAVLVKTVDKAIDICRRIPSISILNLGGGYRLAALSSDPQYDHHRMGAQIAAALEKFAKETQRKLLLELEPGTYLMALAGSLITTIIDAVDTGPFGYQFLKLDGGLTELIRPSYYGALHPLVSVAKDGSIRSGVDDYMVNGHCCIAGDCFTPIPGNSEDFAPQTLSRSEIGDYVVVERVGGYAASMCLKNFNSYPESAEMLRLAPNNYILIRRRQTFDQIIQNEAQININDLVNPETVELEAR